MRDLEKRVLKLERARSTARREVVTLIVSDGEDSELVTDAWQAEHPGADAAFVLMAIIGRPPREGFATRETVLGALPLVKSFAKAAAVDTEAWRRWAHAAGVAWESVALAAPNLSPSTRHD